MKSLKSRAQKWRRRSLMRKRLLSLTSKILRRLTSKILLHLTSKILRRLTSKILLHLTSKILLILTRRKIVLILTRKRKKQHLQITTPATMPQTMNQHRTQAPLTKDLSPLTSRVMILHKTCTQKTTTTVKN